MAVTCAGVGLHEGKCTIDVQWRFRLRDGPPPKLSKRGTTIIEEQTSDPSLKFAKRPTLVLPHCFSPDEGTESVVIAPPTSPPSATPSRRGCAS